VISNKEIVRATVTLGLLFSATIAHSSETANSAQPSAHLRTLTADQLNIGYARLSETLAAIVPEFTSPLFANQGASAHARTLHDRGLSPDQMLILVNGERRYKSAIAHVADTPAQGSLAVDLDTIPLAAIERVEISRVAGNVEHGSAGAAGVINIVLKQRRSGGELYADFYQHSTEIIDVADVAGANTAPGIIGLTTAGDRNPDDGDGDTLSVGGSWSFAVGETGSFTAAASYLDRTRTSREGYSRGQLYPLVGGSFDQREITTERLLQKFGDADTQELNFSLAFEQAVHGMRFKAFATYAARTAKSFSTFRRPVDVPTAALAYPDGFLPEQTSDSDGLAITFQLSGKNFGWDWLATYHGGEDELDWKLQDSVNLSLLNQAVPTTDFLIGNNESRIQETSLKATRSLALPFAESNQIRAGFDYQVGDHEIERGDQAAFLNGGALDALGSPLPAGSQGVIGIRPRNEFDEGRTTYALFGELTSLWRNNTLTTTVGARYSDYDDIGGELDLSANADWRVAPATTISFNATRGHRAPDIGQRFYNGTFTRYFAQTLTRVEVLRNDDPALASFGGSALDAETAISLNLAARHRVSPALSVHASLGYVQIDDRVLLSEALGGAAVDTLFAAREIEAERLSFYTNGADSKTTSLDVGANYRLTLSGSHIDFDLDASLYTTSADATTSAVGRRVLERLENGGPGAKAHFRTNWQRPRTSFEFRATWIGGSTHPGDTAADDHKNGSGVLLDLILEYRLNKHLSASFGGLNLFDAYPDVFEGESALTANGFETPFSSYSAWGFNGRSVYLALRANLP